MAVAFSVEAVGGVYPHYSLQEGDQDLRYNSGGIGVPLGKQMVFGDVDGDGHRDAFFMRRVEVKYYDHDQITCLVLLRGTSVRQIGVVYLGGDFRFAFSDYQLFDGDTYDKLNNILDFNRDGKTDFVYHRGSRFVVFLGLPSFWDLNLKASLLDLRFLYRTQFLYFEFPTAFDQPVSAVGDINGDGISDLVVSESSPSPLYTSDSAYVILGSSTWTNEVTVDQSPGVLRWKGFDRCLSGTNPVFDWNNDGYADVVFNHAGNIEVLFGTGTPSGYDTTRDSPGVRITPAAGWTLSFDLSDDLTGDGRPDMVVREISGGIVRWRLLNATTLPTFGSVSMDQLSSQVVRVGTVSERLETSGDFDGDGVSDLVWSSSATVRTQTQVFLAGDQPTAGSWNSDPSFTIEGDENEWDEYQLIDTDEDGKEDLWITHKPNGGIYNWHVNVFYGFRPIKNPHLVLTKQKSGSKRVSVKMTADGEPTEMKFGGHVHHPAPGTWLPFQDEQILTLTDSPGPKTVSVSFRNGDLRESPSATLTVNPVELGGEPVVPYTNRLKGGSGTIQMDCRSNGGRLTAVIYERGGRRIKTLFDEETVGLITVSWDGKNEFGQPVAPGVYSLVVNADGRRTHQDLLVEP